MSETQTQRRRFSLPGWLAAILAVFIAAGLPLLLLLINARLMMSPIFMQAEYRRPGFPADFYGFTTEDRLRWGPMGLAYLFNNSGIEYLGDLKFPDGTPLFNDRELSHMHDVKLVTQKLVRFGFTLLGIYIVALALLIASRPSHGALFQGLLVGSILTVLLIVVGIGAILFAFEALFTAFHNLFFAGGTWVFPYSDTLIRLYPEQFWMDAFGLVFGGAILEAIVIGVIARRRMRQHNKVTSG